MNAEKITTALAASAMLNLAETRITLPDRLAFEPGETWFFNTGEAGVKLLSVFSASPSYSDKIVFSGLVPSSCRYREQNIIVGSFNWPDNASKVLAPRTFISNYRCAKRLDEKRIAICAGACRCQHSLLGPLFAQLKIAIPEGNRRIVNYIPEAAFPDILRIAPFENYSYQLNIGRYLPQANPGSQKQA